MRVVLIGKTKNQDTGIFNKQKTKIVEEYTLLLRFLKAPFLNQHKTLKCIYNKKPQQQTMCLLRKKFWIYIIFPLYVFLIYVKMQYLTFSTFPKYNTQHIYFSTSTKNIETIGSLHTNSRAVFKQKYTTHTYQDSEEPMKPQGLDILKHIHQFL